MGIPKDPRRLAVESVLCWASLIRFSGYGISLIWSLGFEILKQSWDDIPDWKYAREVERQK